MSDRVLVTGISGFLGSHVALQLLEAGFTVRGSVRNLNKADKVRATLQKAGAETARLEFVALDLMNDAGWAEAMADVRYLQHVASPFVISMPNDKMELITPAVEGTRRALETAFAAQIERVVLTSSIAAIQYGHDKSHTVPFTAADWTNLGGRGVNAYVESKTRAEQEAWAIAKRLGRTSDLAVVNPAAILGPLLDEDPGTSAALVVRMLNGSLPMLPNMYLSIIDVRDVAAAQVAAMTSPDAGGQRFPTAGPTHSFSELAEMLRPRLSAEHVRKLPRARAPDWLVRLMGLFDRDIRGNLDELGVIKRVDGSAGERLIGRRYITVGDALVATADSIIAHKLI